MSVSKSFFSAIDPGTFGRRTIQPGVLHQQKRSPHEFIRLHRFVSRPNIAGI